MLKAFTPVAILLISWTFRIQEPSKRLGVIVLMISSGVALASRGELRFNLIGFLTQAAAVAVSTSIKSQWLAIAKLIFHDRSSRRRVW